MGWLSLFVFIISDYSNVNYTSRFRFHSQLYEMEPFTNGYFEWHKHVKEMGYKVVTVVSRGDNNLPLAAGAVKQMSKTLQVMFYLHVCIKCA